MRRKSLIGSLVALAAILTMSLGTSHAEIYLGAGTAVYKQQGKPPAADEGVLACSTTGVSFGGACIPFGTGGFVAVNDVLMGSTVAFQVCIDNDGDSVCTSPDKGRPCGDIVVFSHDDEGVFHNPLGPLPTSFNPGCPGGPWKGYVVFLCEGVHEGRQDGTPTGGPGTPHTHQATIGTVLNAGPLPPSGFGNFCGGVVENPTRKRYVVV